VTLVLTQVAWLVALAGTAWSAGWLAWGRRRPGLLLHPLPACLGLALVGHAVLALATAGALRPWPLLAGVLAIHLAALRGWRQALGEAGGRIARAPRRAAAWTAVAAVALSPGFVIGLYPPHAFDETVYHLPFARALVATGSLPYLPELRTPVFPLLAESLQALLLLAGGDEATHLVSLLATALTAALLLAWGAESMGREASWLAAALYLGSPLVAYLAGTGYVDPLLAMLTGAGLYAAWRSSREEDRGWAVAAGLLAGSAAAVKYLGLAAVAVAALALLSGRRRGRAGAFLLAAAPVALPTYLWIWSGTGNPLHPFYPQLFGSSVWMPALEPARGLLERAGDLAALPFDAVWRRQATGNAPPLSPAFLLGVPLLVWCLVRWRPARGPSAMLGLGFASLLLVPAHARYLLPWLPLWSLLLAAAAVWAVARRDALRGNPLRGDATGADATGGDASRLDAPAIRGRSVAAAVLAAGLLLPGALYGPFYVARAGAVPTTPAARREFLAVQIPGYRALAWLADGGADPSAVIYALAGERLYGVAPQPILGEHTGPYAYRRVEPLLSEPHLLARELRALGATHLLLPAASAALLPAEAGPLRRSYADAEATLFEVVAPPTRVRRQRRALQPRDAAPILVASRSPAAAPPRW
jgi:hypothetical protein